MSHGSTAESLRSSEVYFRIVLFCTAGYVSECMYVLSLKNFHSMKQATPACRKKNDDSPIFLPHGSYQM
jgi:hypothetical protein